MKHNYPILPGCLGILLSALTIQSAIGEETNDWQSRRLMHPTADELNWEQSGNIMIYDGMTDRQVSAAMDDHFGRIQSMMFTGIIVTDEKGKPAEDPVTGDIITENDGCD
jgi:hypothetical protein